MPQRAKIGIWVWGVLNAVAALAAAILCVYWLEQWQSGGVLGYAEAQFRCGVFLFGAVCALQNAYGAYLIYQRRRVGYYRLWLSYVVALVGWFYLRVQLEPQALQIAVLGGYAALLAALYWLLDVASCGKVAKES